MHNPNANAIPICLNREQRIREAALLIFSDPFPQRCLLLGALSESEWQGLLRWLDISGLALYFLDRISELGLREMLPQAVLMRLQQNLMDNTERMRGMIEESTAIHCAFQGAGVSYAVLKGFSLWPDSVPKPELRSQLDLDFLVAEANMPEAQGILADRGYHLHAVSGRSWEFKASQIPGASLKDLYKPTPYRSVELHVQSGEAGNPSLLARVESRTIHGIDVPVLAPADLFLGQGMHLYKHVSHDFARASHVIEFRRHVLARYKEENFWAELQHAAAQCSHASIGLGVSTMLISRLMGDFAPKALTCWTVDSLPPLVRLWVEMYGHRVIFSDFPGNKLYLLLQKELESAGISARHARRRALLPLSLPPAIIKAPERETLSARIHRYYAQMRFVLFRLRFHFVEGLRYLLESHRWQKHRNSLEGVDALLFHARQLPTHVLQSFLRSTKE